MRWWPWVSRRVFLAVLEAKNEVIASQREHIKELREILARPVAVTVTLPKDFAVVQPALVSDRSKRAKKKQQDAIGKIDLAEIDLNDPVQLATLVNYELGERAQSANRWERRQVLRGLLVRIRAAKDEKLRQRSIAADSKLPASLPDDQAASVPQHIREMVESAERGN